MSLGKMDVRVTDDRYKYYAPGEQVFLPVVSGVGGTWKPTAAEGEPERGFNVRTIDCVPIPETADGMLANASLPPHPVSFVLIDAASDVSLVGKRLSLTLAEVTE